jgi:glutathione synthase/RimK-type ligase-like ATP-grasp enzyme
MEPSIAISSMEEEREPGGHPTLPEAFSEVEEWADVTHLDAKEEHDDLDWSRFDMYRMEKRTPEAVEDLRRADLNGVETVNPRDATETVINRRRRYNELSGYLPVPEAEFGPVSQTEIGTPAILKKETQWEDGGLEQEVAFNESALERESERMVQEYIDFDTEYKGYQFGDEFRLTELPETGNGARTQVFDGQDYRAVQRIAERVSEGTGLNIFGVDVIVSDGQYWLVDVNDEGSYRGVSDAEELYSDTLYQRAREALPGFDERESTTRRAPAQMD